MKRTTQRKLEHFAVLLWRAIAASERHGGVPERARLIEAANAMHAARMVLHGRAAETADTLCNLAWARLTRLDQCGPAHRWRARATGQEG